MRIYKIEFESEVCCDECCEIVHNHFDGPICNKDFAGTSIYDAPSDYDEFECEECGAKFKRITREDWRFLGIE